MIDVFHKRPFVRPLFIWIMGICLQIACPGYLIGVVCGVAASFGTLLAWIAQATGRSTLLYSTRWVWGVLFTLSLLSFASWVTLAEERLPVGYKSAWVRQAQTVQNHLVEKLDRLALDETEKSVLATVTLGYRKEMSREVKQRFSAAGVSHILAVSGFHVMVVCGFVSWGLGFLPAWGYGGILRFGLMLGLLWIYICVAGLAASAVRAGIMLTIYLTGKQFRLWTDNYNTWAAAAFLMLVYNPFYLFDIGFQLSYLAVLSIFYFKPRLDKLIMVRNPLIAKPWGCVTLTLAAQMGTAPLCFYYFGRLSPAFLFTNVPLTFVATLLIPLGLIWLLLPEWVPGVDYLQAVVEWLTGTMVRVVELFSGTT